MSQEDLMVVFIVAMYLLVILPLFGWAAQAVLVDILSAIENHKRKMKELEKEKHESDRGNKM